MKKLVSNVEKLTSLFWVLNRKSNGSFQESFQFKSLPKNREVIFSVKLIVLFVLLACQLSAQKYFGDACLGNWNGVMYIYARGQLRDSVPVKLNVAKTSTTDAWTWKTSYLSPTRPMVKDYVLRLKDASKGHYITDEGGGVELTDYYFNNKLYCVFETAGVMLTSTYELRGEELIFEVTSGKKEAAPKGEVINYSTDNLQRVVFKREK